MKLNNAFQLLVKKCNTLFPAVFLDSIIQNTFNIRLAISVTECRTMLFHYDMSIYLQSEKRVNEQMIQLL